MNARQQGFRFGQCFDGAALLVLAVIICGAATACSSLKTMPVKAVVHGSADLKSQNVQALLVLDFDGPGHSGQDVGQDVADIFSKFLAEGRYFKVIDRLNLQALKKVLPLAMAGGRDEKQAAEAGKRLGADAVIVGQVPTFSVWEKPVYFSEKHGKDETFGKYFELNGKVSVSFRVIRAETGEVLARKSASRSYHCDDRPSEGILPGFPAQRPGCGLKREEVLPALLSDVLKELEDELQRTFTAPVGFETGGVFTSDAALMHGIEIIKANRFDDGVKYYEKLVQQNSANDGSLYNLGMAYLLVGNYDKAEQAFRNADKITPKKLYREMIAIMPKIRDAKFKGSKVEQVTYGFGFRPSDLLRALAPK